MFKTKLLLNYYVIQFYQEMKESETRRNMEEAINSPKDMGHNRSSSGSLNKYGRSPYLQRIAQGFTLPKKSLNGVPGTKPKQPIRKAQKNNGPLSGGEQSIYKNNMQMRSRSNMAVSKQPKGSPNFRLPKIAPEHLRTDRRQKKTTSSFSATLDLNTNKKKLSPIQNTFRRHYISKTKAGTNGKQTKINQDIAIIENTLPHGIKLYCVCDGHGLNGHLVSQFIKHHLIKNLNRILKKQLADPPKIQSLLEQALEHTNDQLLNSDINTQLSGSTVIAVFIYKETIYSFNVGDSRAILAEQEGEQWKSIPLSSDQKPEREDEKKRILEFGGRIQTQKNERGQDIGPERVWMQNIQMPGLAMTRSFGDKAGRKAGTNGDPELLVRKITENDKFLVVASDGVWQYLENQQVMNIIIPFYLRNDVDLGAEKVIRISSEIWHKLSYSRDDITLIIVSLNPANKPSQPEKSNKVSEFNDKD